MTISEVPSPKPPEVTPLEVHFEGIVLTQQLEEASATAKSQKSSAVTTRGFEGTLEVRARRQKRKPLTKLDLEVPGAGLHLAAISASWGKS